MCCQNEQDYGALGRIICLAWPNLFLSFQVIFFFIFFVFFVAFYFFFSPLFFMDLLFLTISLERRVEWRWLLWLAYEWCWWELCQQFYEAGSSPLILVNIFSHALFYQLLSLLRWSHGWSSGQMDGQRTHLKTWSHGAFFRCIFRHWISIIWLMFFSVHMSSCHSIPSSITQIRFS